MRQVVKRPVKSRINRLLSNNDQGILSIYFTAGYPQLEDTGKIALELQKSGVDMIEIGIPYSDPVADGPVIQESSMKSIENGTTLKVIFEQLKEIKNEVKIPVVLMGYLNPIYQYGIEKFCKSCYEAKIEGVIIPDLPLDIYQRDYVDIFMKYQLHHIFLITPLTSIERVKMVDSLSNSFIYMVSASSTTGPKKGFEKRQLEYFEKIKNMDLNNRCLIGFGISDHQSYKQALKFASGVIIGSAFINELKTSGISGINKFIANVRDRKP